MQDHPRTGSGPRLWASIAVAASLAWGAAGLVHAESTLPAVQHQGDVEWISGGIGQEQSTAFKEAMSQYPLAITFASRIGTSNAYVADVHVAIRKDQQSVLDTTAEGPYMLVRLPAGTYTVRATYNGDMKTAQTTVGSSGTQRLFFEWTK